jgi:hypothetical protein
MSSATSPTSAASSLAGYQPVRGRMVSVRNAALPGEEPGWRMTPVAGCAKVPGWELRNTRGCCMSASDCDNWKS